MRTKSTRMSPKMAFFFSRVFPLPFILIGVVVLYIGSRDFLRARESVNWPTAQGVVQNSEVEYHRGDKGGGTYHAEIMYNFKIDETTHSGNDVAFGDYGSSDSSHAQGIMNRYPKGKEVTVFYMKEKPEVCVLEPGVKMQAWFLPAFGLIFFVVGSLMAIFLPKVMKHMPNKPNQEDDFQQNLPSQNLMEP